MKIKYLVVLLFAGGHVFAEDVAVIIGGQFNSWQGHQCLQSVEIYTKHLSKDKLVCNNTNEEPHIPDLPIPIYAAAAVFLPQFGIYLCGGINDKHEPLKTCYRYDPRVKK